MELTRRIEQNVQKQMTNLQSRVRQKIQEHLITARACVITAMVVSSIMLLFFVVAMNSLEASYAAKIADISASQITYNTEVNEAHAKELSVTVSKYEADIAELNEQLAAKDELIAKLQNDQFVDYQNASYLLDKYDYVFDRMSSASGITLDDIAYYDNMCKENNWNPHIMWCIYWNESKFTSVIDSSLSTARGLGQILHSTAKSMYENILQLGTYTHDMAYDTQTNMLLTTNLLFRNMNQGLKSAIALYSGDRTGSYYNLVCHNAATFGVDIYNTTYQ